MTTEGLRLTSYTGERQSTGHQCACQALLGLYREHGIAAGMTLRGIQGFGRYQRLHTDQSLTLSEDLPLVALAVDTRPLIEDVVERAQALTSPGLLTVEQVLLVNDKVTPDSLPASMGAEDVKLAVHLGRQDEAFQIPAFEAICDLRSALPAVHPRGYRAPRRRRDQPRTPPAAPVLRAARTRRP